jgi:hypothetical protein
MKEVSLRLMELNCEDLFDAISSPDLQGGSLPCGLRDGQTIGQFGQEVALASRIPPLGSNEATPMNATCGQPSPALSPSAALSECLASRLRARLNTGGLIEYAETWKRKNTPSGRSLFQLVASARRTLDKDCSGERLEYPEEYKPLMVPTRKGDQMRLETSEEYWKRMSQLEMEAKLIPGGWPTPTAADHSRGKGTIREHDTGIPLPQRAQMAGWPTPDCSDRRSDASKQQGTSNVAKLAGWPTPAMTDHKGGYLGGRMRNGQWSADRLDITAQLMLTGEMLSGGHVEMESIEGYRLNPYMSSWLMGYPAKWCSALLEAASRSRRNNKGQRQR